MYDSAEMQMLADQALAQYPQKYSAVTYLQHSGVIAFHVQDTWGTEYLLRIHSPVSEFIAEAWVSPELIDSEMMWLSYLHDDGGIVVQKPVKTKDGEWFATVVTSTGKGIPSTLLQWITGECDHEHRLTREEVRNCALSLAHLHRLWTKWSAPSDFIRPSYDIRYLHRSLSEARKHVTRNVIDQADFVLIEESVKVIETLMLELGDSNKHWGLVHGDFSPLNLVFQKSKVIPIDFSECGFGHYLLDVGSFLLRCGPQKQCFLQEYGRVRELPENVYQLAEVFVLAHIVRWLAFTASLPDRYQKVSRLVKYPTMDYCRQFLAGKLFLFE